MVQQLPYGMAGWESWGPCQEIPYEFRSGVPGSGLKMVRHVAQRGTEKIIIVAVSAYHWQEVRESLGLTHNALGRLVLSLSGDVLLDAHASVSLLNVPASHPPKLSFQLTYRKCKEHQEYC